MITIEKINFNNQNDIITCVFCCSNDYIPYLSVSLLSVIENSIENINYDIVILSKDISNINKSLITSLNNYLNISIRFFNPEINLNKDVFFVHEHVTSETFFKIFIPEIFSNYDKVLVCDADIVVTRDISELFFTNIANFPIAASKSYLWNGIINQQPRLFKYTTEFLNLEYPENYIQCGVLLFNIKLFNKLNFKQKLIHNLKNRKFICMDQDLFNMTFKNFYKEFSCNWNYEVQLSIFKDSIAYISPKMLTTYMNAMKSPFILHFSGKNKPWFYPEEEFSNIWWQYAKKSPFYETIISRMNSHLCKEILKELKNLNKYKFKYIKFKILCIVTPKKFRSKYKNKVSYYKHKIFKISQLLK